MLEDSRSLRMPGEFFEAASETRVVAVYVVQKKKSMILRLLSGSLVELRTIYGKCMRPVWDAAATCTWVTQRFVELACKAQALSTTAGDDFPCSQIPDMLDLTAKLWADWTSVRLCFGDARGRDDLEDVRKLCKLLGWDFLRGRAGSKSHSPRALQVAFYNQMHTYNFHTGQLRGHSARVLFHA